MATLASTMQDELRFFLQDTDTSVGTDFSEAQLRILLNHALLWQYENTEKRVKYVTLIAALADNTYFVDGDSTVLYPEILQVFLARTDLAAGTVEDKPLFPLPWSEIANRQADIAAAGTPTHCAYLKYGAAGVASGAQNKWKFAFYPPTSGGPYIIRGLVRDNPVQLSANGDFVDLDDFGARIAVLIAAVLGAPLKGAPELADNAMKFLPKEIQDKIASRPLHDEAISA